MVNSLRFPRAFGISRTGERPRRLLDDALPDRACLRLQHAASELQGGAARVRRSASTEMERQDHDGRGGRPLVRVGVGDSRQGEGSKVYAWLGAAAADVSGKQNADDATAVRR